MTHTESIELGLNEKRPHIEIIRKVYLTYPTSALIGDEERQFSILNEISEFFNIPINNVQIAGSAKTGNSYHKNTPFTPKISDLDIAIIDPELYRYYTEYVFKTSRGFKDRTLFPIRSGISTYNEYISYITKGIFRPDLMINGPKRAEWFMFFGKLSTKHKDLFETINAGIYMSQLYFEHKQTSIIKDYLTTKAI
ncbi:hypothetical protein ABS764_00135 [Flavobacterium sp. ST-87]|uniref:Nucleotidyltransferase domain-containing protein n=1 Tax=Flavobacterium plantiphilum TaxID=3163297 RepID=A0ABW8XP30_9FLAO